MIQRASPPIIGQSLPIQRLRTLIAKIGPLDLPVLIQGPTGSGKELVAQAVHAASGRLGRLVAFNVCAIPDNLLEAALFGHVRGGFTGAHHDVPGYLVEADQGTVFFDEIGGLPLALQPKLLRTIETRDFRPVGGRADRHSEFRVVSATNNQLEPLIQRGDFRADLAYRLRATVLPVPSLKARMEDVPLLADFFLRGARKKDDPERAIEAAGLDLPLAYDWPGNVRELRYVVETAAALSPERVLRVADLHEALTQGNAGSGPLSECTGARRRVLDALEGAAWDTAPAARALCVHRATVYRWMRRVGIDPPRRRVGFASIRANSHPFAANSTLGD